MPRPPEVDPLVHAPARLAILATLAALESADFLYLLHATGLTKGNLSAHLAKLEAAGYVAVEKTYQGRRPLTLVSLTDSGRQALAQYRRQMGDFLDQMRP